MSKDLTDSAQLTRQRTILRVFEEALDKPGDQQTIWLHALHGGDPGLIAEVEALIAADRVASGMLPTLPVLPFASIPERVGAYRIVGTLGSGGMGDVYLGERDDGLFQHRVAIKVLRSSPFASPGKMLFDVERRVLARLRHRHIARLFDGGVTENGAPWFIMELIEGEPIDAYAKRLALDAKAVARLIADVCGAVQYAHQNLVVHADIKPSNILVEADGEFMLLDFGVAQLIEDVAIDGDVPGLFPRTPAYSSPQRMAGARPKPADDIYALGIVLRTLIGDRPDTDDLAAIIAKGSATDPSARYTSAAAMREDLLRWLDRRTISARPHSWRYAAGRFVARNRWAVAAAGAGFLMLIAALVTMSLLYASSERSRLQAERRFHEVRGLANFTLFDLYDDLADAPGTVESRASLAITARGYLDRLNSISDSSPALRFDIARAYVKLATLQGSSITGSLGQPDQSRRSLDIAEPMLRQLLVERYRDGAVLEELGWVYQRRWTLLGESAESPMANGIAADFFRRSLDTEPQRQGVLIGLFTTEYNRGYELIWADRSREAKAILQGVLRRLRTATFDRDHSDTANLLEVNILSRLGDTAYHEDDLPRALAFYRDADAIIQRKLAQRDSLAWVDRLGDTKFNISGTLGDMPGHEREALAEARTGITRLQRALAYGPDANLEKRLLVLYGQEALLLSQLGDHRQAVDVLDRSIALREARVSRQPADPQRNRDLAIGLTSGIELLVQADRRDDACRMARRATLQWETIAVAGNLGERDAGRNKPQAEAAVSRLCRDR